MTNHSNESSAVGQGEYVVQAGDCTASIAAEHGHIWQTIWNDPSNAEVKRVRKDPYVLLPGDKIHIPPLRLNQDPEATENRHQYVKSSRLLLKIVFKDEERPRANQGYGLTVDGSTHAGTTDASGMVLEKIPANARFATLHLEESQETYFFELGCIDPLDSVTGIQGRLFNLGFHTGEVNGVFDAKTRSALRSFQEKYNLPATGENDEQTQQKLKEIYGC